MKAMQYSSVGEAPKVVEVPVPEPSGEEVLVKVTAAGACHSDELIMSFPANQLAALGVRLPLTLGHEGAGVVEAVGPASQGVEVGQPVVIYGPWGCGVCATCAGGDEQYCERAAALAIRPPGLGAPGAMAEYVLVDHSRHLVPLDGLDPVVAAPLTDAGLTPYHAIKPVLPQLVPGSTAVVIGAGGLGHLGIQILRALSSCQVVALDLGEEKLAFATEVGAHHAFTSDDSAVAKIQELTGGHGAAAVFDFVGADPTCALAAQVVRTRGEIVIVGIGGGTVPVGFFTLPYNVSVRAPYWGSLPELHEVLALARSGAVHVDTERYSLDDAPSVYERMHARTLRGRAVVVP